MNFPCHAIVRAKERYGLTLDKYDLQEIVHLIQNNHGKLIEHYKSDSGMSRWLLTYKDIPMCVLMSPDLYRVVTFPPLHKRNKKQTYVRYVAGRPEYVRKRA